MIPEPVPSSIEAWRGITQTPEIVQYFRGLFDRMSFTVPLRVDNIQRLVAHARDGRIDPGEFWRIALRNPVMASRWIRRMAGVEDLIHVYLIDPAGQQQATHTLLDAARQWVVLPGLHGVAARIYRLTPDQSLDYQRHVFAAMKRDLLVGWWSFTRWYRRWREAVSSTV